jgi:hypothetical protein
VPLSDHEEQLLSQMEQQLLSEDPKFASAMRGSSHHPRGGRRIILGGLAVVGGLVLLVFAAVSNMPLVALPGFLIMLAGVTYAFSRPSPGGPVGVVGPGGATRARPAAGGGGRSGKGLMDRLEQRWDRRRGDLR